jgi:hypothetical protein
MFICLLVFQLRGGLYVITAAIAGILAVILSLLLPGNAYIVLTSVLAATIGVVLQRLRPAIRESGTGRQQTKNR